MLQPPFLKRKNQRALEDGTCIVHLCTQKCQVKGRGVPVMDCHLIRVGGSYEYSVVIAVIAVIRGLRGNEAKGSILLCMHF